MGQLALRQGTTTSATSSMSKTCKALTVVTFYTEGPPQERSMVMELTARCGVSRARRRKVLGED